MVRVEFGGECAWATILMSVMKVTYQQYHSSSAVGGEKRNQME